jgi:hypothetical protein
MMVDLDRNGVLDGEQGAWDGGRPVTAENVRAEFSAREAQRPGGTKPTEVVESTDTLGRYNPRVAPHYHVRQIRSAGFQDLGANGPMVQVSQNLATRAWRFTINSWYSHASVETLRAAAHLAFCKECLGKDAGGLDAAEQNLMAMIFAASSLVYDNGWNDRRIWPELCRAYNLPEIDLGIFEDELDWEHHHDQHDLTGGSRNVERIMGGLSAAQKTALAAPRAGVFAPVQVA